MIYETMIARAVELLQRAAPDATIILFGSHARGDAHAESDLDFLVIEPEVRARREEMVRLRDALRPLRIPVDVLVASRKTFDEWADTPGSEQIRATVRRVLGESRFRVAAQRLAARMATEDGARRAVEELEAVATSRTVAACPVNGPDGPRDAPRLSVAVSSA